MTIALIEDDDAVLDSLSLLMAGRGMKVSGFRCTEDFLSAELEGDLSCIVSDVRLPGLSGLDLQRWLREQGVGTPLILITGHGDVPMAVKAIKDGAFDFVEKPYDPETLIATVEKACGADQRTKAREGQKAELAARIAGLPRRQREVMALVVEGLSNKQIALRLEISPRTVENYRAWLMQRLGATSLADLVRKVMMVQAESDD